MQKQHKRRPRPFAEEAVRAVFEAYPAQVRTSLLDLRELIFDTAHQTAAVGPLRETLKWEQPAYLPVMPKIGTTVRLGAAKSGGAQIALLFHCQTTLVATFRELYGNKLVFEGNRAIILSSNQKPPREPLRHCIALALTYHLQAKRT